MNEPIGPREYERRCAAKRGDVPPALLRAQAAFHRMEEVLVSRFQRDDWILMDENGAYRIFKKFVDAAYYVEDHHPQGGVLVRRIVEEPVSLGIAGMFIR